MKFLEHKINNFHMMVPYHFQFNFRIEMKTKIFFLEDKKEFCDADWTVKNDV